MGLEDELQKIFDSEIYVSISRSWDGGITVKLGDEIKGIVAQANVGSVRDIVPWLQSAILDHYPTSKYHLARMASSNGSSE
jgi:hypothetical protein